MKVFHFKVFSKNVFKKYLIFIFFFAHLYSVCPVPCIIVIASIAVFAIASSASWLPYSEFELFAREYHMYNRHSHEFIITANSTRIHIHRHKGVKLLDGSQHERQINPIVDSECIDGRVNIGYASHKALSPIISLLMNDLREYNLCQSDSRCDFASFARRCR